MGYFAFFFLHFCIYIFYKSMHRECKYYLCKQNKWMNTQMRKKQNCIKVQQGTNFPGKGKSFRRRFWTPGGRGGGQQGVGDQWPVCVASALLLVLTWNTLPRKASGVSSNPTTVGLRDLPGLYQLKSWSCCQTTSEINPGPSGWKLAGPGPGPGSLFLICRGSAELANWHGTAEAVKSSPATHVPSGLFTVACVPCPRPLFPKDTLPSLTCG